MKSIGIAIATLVLTFTSTMARAELPGSARIRTVRSLARLHEDIYARYLNLDEASGNLTLHDRSDQNNSGGFWRMRRTFPYRGYHKVFVFETRMNGKPNGAFLGINPNTGEFEMRWTHDRETTNWSIRYAGKHHGFDAFVIQNLAHSPGGFDMHFLSVDPTTGRPKMTKELGETSYWFIGDVEDLPTEVLGDQGLSAFGDDAGVGF
jgi:hypothetical protein